MKVYMLSKRHIFIGTIFLIAFILGILCWMGLAKNTFTYKSHGEPIRNGDPASNKMAITCNVDWGNEVIPELLKILDEKNIKITFFVTGRWASNNPELLKEIYHRGHEIGNHGYGHKMHSKISREANIWEIKKTEEIIENIIGVKCKYFAPPAGDFNQTTLEVAGSLGYKTILWNIDTIDWREDSTADVIIKRVMNKSHRGAILLMHPKPETIKALPYIIEKISEKNIKIGTVSNLLH
ncbi:Peptidoglycan-N-acetylglucosamine deacetylase [Thermotalea metallivorans]|uniref:Peptidoglycan-N-acetylglucosamine deacetylase n=1 Tax=Thermotalea metallivorans TaxID=520762 RepID=A0A140L5H7_9FIRM|nr:Peptidoglycan-N-acetylglucosamine deacetylase [Thermotalea metallivorans]